MLETKENSVRIEGILSEIDLKYGTFNKNGVDNKTISGSIKVLVDQVMNGVNTTLEVPVHIFACQYTNKGTINPAYENAEKVMTEYVSVAASDMERADRVLISRGQITMNEYYGRSGNLISFPRIKASFITKINKNECKPEASFTVVMMIGSKGYETDKDGVETEKYKIVGMIPRFGGAVDVVPFYAINPGVIDSISQYWTEGDTVKAMGKLNFSSSTTTEKVEVDFGDPVERERTISVSDLIITGGSSTPLEGDFAFNEKDIQDALARRKANLAALKESSGKKNKAPAKGASKFSDIGF